MHQEIDIESVEFKNELANTEKFLENVIKKHNFVLNSYSEIVRGISFGLTRNQMIYGTKYCPCFFVTKTIEDRICPCTPALEDEIPNTGTCHCQIFVDPSFDSSNKDNEISSDLMSKDQLSSEDLEELILLRKRGKISFKLVDVREMMEYKYLRIKGTDFLVPTTRFYDAVKEIESLKNETVIIYCHVVSRIGYVHQVMKQMGFKNVLNLTYGIASFGGEVERG